VSLRRVIAMLIQSAVKAATTGIGSLPADQVAGLLAAR
jgi:hypothetical protein